MRALSVRQPWAELIARGQKKIEYRTWKVDFRGDLLIVASASRQDAECRKQKLDPESLAYGAAVCVVELVKVTGDAFDYKWHVRNPRRVQPVKVRGYAAIYNVDDEKIRFSKGTVPAKKKQKASTPRSPRRESVRRADAETKPLVVVAAPRLAVAKDWASALREHGFRTLAVRDGLAAWRELASAPASVAVLAHDIAGYPVDEVTRRLEDSAAHRSSMAVVVGGARRPVSTSSRWISGRGGRAQVATAVAKALQDA